MRKILFAILLTASMLIACSKSNNDSNTDKDSIGYFNANLTADLKYTDIVNLFGEPDGDLGSGIHIYYYNLSDGTKVYIGYTDKILYARHVSSSGQVLHTIV
jgi:hypothetical protein